MALFQVTGALWIMVAVPSLATLAWLMIFAFIPAVLCSAGAAIGAFRAPRPEARWLLAVSAAIAGLPHLFAVVVAPHPAVIYPTWWFDLFMVALAAWSEFLAWGLWDDYQAPRNAS